MMMRMMSFLRSVIIVAMSVVIYGCNRVESISEMSAVEDLRGRCIELRQPMAVVDSGGSGVADAYLSPGSVSVGTSGRQYLVDVGAKFVITDVVMETKFEGADIHVVGRDREGQSLALTFLFDSSWLATVRRVVDDEQSVRTNETEEALDPRVAGWCTD